MAKNTRRDQSADELKIEAVRTRDRLGRDVRALRYELDFPRKLKRSFRQQTIGWITAAVVVGTLLVVLPARKKKVYVEPKLKTSAKDKQKKFLEAGFALGALKFAATLLKPVIVAFVTKKVRGYIGEPRRREKVAI